jgi:hypothetical protein
VPAIAAVGGAVSTFRERARLGWMLVPAAIAFVVFMGTQGRYYGRWLLPIFPIVCLLAAHFALALIRRLSGADPWFGVRAVGGALACFALCAQGVVASVHVDEVLSRADTRSLTRAWLVAHVPAGSRVVIEPVVPAGWAQDIGHPDGGTPDGNRWIKYTSLRAVISSAGVFDPSRSYVVSIEDYERTLGPALIGWYEQRSYCWIVSGSTQSGRAFAHTGDVPGAIAYYGALEREAKVVFRSSPYGSGSKPVAFNFDWSFDYYPAAYARPGPQMTVYRLDGGRCAQVS